MIKVIITKLNGGSFSNILPSQKEAEEWVKNHKAKGKDATIITSPNRIDGAKLLEEVTGPMGVKLLKQELPAEYTVEYIEEHLYDRENKMTQMIKKRDSILCATDWLFIADVIVDQKHRKMYMTYRQYLRDLPKKIGSSDAIEIEAFEHWLRRKHPSEFMDGGQSEKIIKKFTYYLED
jgi:hypothetical protein